ncbi:MAG TPA: BamA/TamA family outer membrane protein [Bacteroidales bacterium]|nr:BamA/TamA family outer membrane protein [Bacteroidales bacterium]
MVIKKFRFASFLLFVLALISSCSLQRGIPEGQYLLRSNKVLVKNTLIKTGQLKPFIRQQPNRQLIGIFPFNLHIYQLADRGRDNAVKRWMKNTIGEPPAIFNPVMMESTRRQFELYMQGKGYFDAQIEASFNSAQGRAIYHITGNTPYTIRNIEYRIADSVLAGIVFTDTSMSMISRGQQYDSELLQNERERVAHHLRNHGYFRFTRDFIFFEVDSALGTHQVDIDMIIDHPSEITGLNEGTSDIAGHRQYRIENVNIYPGFSPFRNPGEAFDTTRFFLERQGDTTFYRFIHQGPLRIRPRVLVQNIHLEPGQFFNGHNVEQTYYSLSGLRNFRFINIQFEEIPDHLQENKPNLTGLLNANIQLASMPANAFTIEAEGLNTAGNLGIGGNLVFSNRNIFGGAERLSLRLKGALEATATAARGDANRLPFNTVELGAEASIDFPRILAPIPLERISKYARPRSNILTGINYRHRPDFTRYIFNISYGIEWSQNHQNRHLLHPLKTSFINIFNDSILLSRIPPNNPLILSRYKDHLTAGINYSFIFNSQQVGRDVDFVYFRGNIETAGNLLGLIAGAFDFPRNLDNKRTLFKIPYAQFIKTDFDLRYYRVFNPNNSLVFRFMAGIGVPFGNSEVLSFANSFYGGGANGLRAWRLYTVGPGAYRDTVDVRFDRFGDIKLEANIEHRFAIYRFFHGALFADAGNVWFINENPQFPGGEFAFNRFFNEIAIGAGLGLRFDFDFFVVRLDAAFRVHDPALSQGQRWLRSWPRFNKWNFNLGIGYPF